MVATVAGWINSCTNERQLATCQDIIDEYIDRRFKNHVSPREMAEALNGLRLEISTRNIILCGTEKVDEVAPYVWPRN